jgi:superfamily II DNA or RNA helicase
MTVIICPNDVVEQWEEKIIQAFPDSVVKSSAIYGKEVFSEKRDEKKHKYLILNYDKFSQDYSNNEVLKLSEQKIDFLILDEVHFVKRRDESEESKRHKLVTALLTYMKKRNKDSKVLVMSATPVINELREGRSVLNNERKGICRPCNKSNNFKRCHIASKDGISFSQRKTQLCQYKHT